MGELQQFPTALHRGSSLVEPKAYRLVKVDDIPWMADLARRRYPANFDIEAATLWMENIVMRQPMVFYPIRTDHAFMVTFIALMPWRPGEPEANVALLCAEEDHFWDAIRLARASLNWAYKRNCFKWGFNSDTEFDIGPIAKRMGIIELRPRYVVNLR